MDFRPVIIIGAPRSGTNLLRDLLTSLPGATTWPCDEINPIWRHGNRSFASDEIPREAATREVRALVRGRFERIAGPDTTHVIEKTCANALRVPFVDAILPEAHYVHIVRDGRDAVVSMMERWTGSASLAYLLRKARFVPATDVPFYAWRFVRARLSRLARADRALSTWGPRFAGIDEMVTTEPLGHVCAEQWRRCVKLAADALERLPAERVTGARYEALVESPRTEVSRIATRVGLGEPGRESRIDAAGVHARSVGRWTADADTVRSLVPRLEPELTRFGYGSD